jgi:hypothetical protein
MTVQNTVDVPVAAPASELWKYVRAYGRMHEYVGFVESTTMDKVEPAVGVLRVLHVGTKHLDEIITMWDEKNMSYTYDIKNGPIYAQMFLITFTVEEVDAKNSKLVCMADLELTTFFSWILPSFLLKKMLGGKQMLILEGYKNAAETNTRE